MKQHQQSERADRARPPQLGRRPSGPVGRKRKLEGAIHQALAGLPGQWEVEVTAQEGRSWTVCVLAPDASARTMTCADPERQIPRFIAETVAVAGHRC